VLHKKIFNWPEWVQSIEDPRLSATVREALFAGDTAVEAGAKKYKNCQRALRSAEQTLDQIRFGRVTGKAACRKAADAIRKFTTAAECAEPTAKR
jgi:hypothetical protein